MKKTFYILCAAATALVSCNKAEVATQIADSSSRQISFCAENFYSFNTKAITNGDAVSVFSGSPVEGAANQQYNITGFSSNAGSLVKAGAGFLWGITQMGTTATAPFYAIYPYSADGRSDFSSTNDLAWNITTAANVSYAMNVLAAYTTASPGEGESKLTSPDAVSLSFKHPFVLLEYTITNNDSFDSIKEVKISQVPNQGYLYYNAALAKPKMESETIVLGEEVMAYSDGKYYAVIFAAEGQTPKVTIEMNSGAKASYTTTSTDFTQGYKYTATIEYTRTHSEVASVRDASVSFTSKETWDSGEISSPGSQTSVAEGTTNSNWPGIRGTNLTIGGSAPTWSLSVPMTCIGDGLYEAEITKVGDGNMEFKVYIKGSNTWKGGGTEHSGTSKWDNTWSMYDDGSGNIVWGESPSIVRFDGTNVYVRTKN